MRLDKTLVVHIMMTACMHSVYEMLLARIQRLASLASSLGPTARRTVPLKPEFAHRVQAQKFDSRCRSPLVSHLQPGVPNSRNLVRAATECSSTHPNFHSWQGRTLVGNAALVTEASQTGMTVALLLSVAPVLENQVQASRFCSAASKRRLMGHRLASTLPRVPVRSGSEDQGSLDVLGM